MKAPTIDREILLLLLLLLLLYSLVLYEKNSSEKFDIEHAAVRSQVFYLSIKFDITMVSNMLGVKN